MPLTPKEARKLLDSFGDKRADATEEPYLHWCVQAEIMKGPHSEELADLNARARAGDTNAQEKADTIIEEITEAHRSRIAQEGLPESWQK